MSLHAQIGVDQVQRKFSADALMRTSVRVDL